MSTFVSHLTHDLSQKVVPPAVTPPGTPGASESPTKESLRSLLLSLNQSASLLDAQGCLQTIRGLTSEGAALSGPDEEEAVLRKVIVNKLAVELYGRALDAQLDEARWVEDELEWWIDIDRSLSSTALYLIQTLPSRLLRLSQTIISTLRSRGLPLHPSLFTPSSLRQLFPSRGVLRPNTLTVALFPHLRAQPYSIALSTRCLPPASAFTTSPRKSIESAYDAFVSSFTNLVRGMAAIVTLPLDLTSSECRYKLEELARVRDEKAETLGSLAEMRDLLASALDEKSSDQSVASMAVFAGMLQYTIQRKDVPADSAIAGQSAVDSLEVVAQALHPSGASTLAAEMRARDLARPSRLTLLWPRLVLLPPLTLYLIRTAYASRFSLHEMAIEAWYTAVGLWEDWLLEPLTGIVETVRTGRDDSVIITRESVKADLDSLERMALALAQEKLRYDPGQMAALSQQIQLGDLTPVMQIYEEDIKSPLKSALGGTLLRTLFIQVQKGKVDIDQALAGIDKLLKSQELTFAFVGVAPALVIVYAAGRYLRSLWAGGRGRGRFGGKHRKISVWLKMRRIERLLISQPRSHREHAGRPRGQPAPSIPPLTSGLLLLSVSHLRSYAEQYLPANSHLREGFLEDVADLEDPALGRTEKLRVLDRMWRSWGETLGWSKAAENMGSR